MRDQFTASSIPSRYPLNGHPVERLVNNANFSFRYVEGVYPAPARRPRYMRIDLYACSSGCLALARPARDGSPPKKVHGSLRLTLGDANTADDIDYALRLLPEVIGRLRRISPLTPAEKRVQEAD